MGSFGPTELFVLNFKGIQEELGKLFSAHGSVQEYWVSQKKTGGVSSGSGLYGVVRRAPRWGMKWRYMLLVSASQRPSLFKDRFKAGQAIGTWGF